MRREGRKQAARHNSLCAAFSNLFSGENVLLIKHNWLLYSVFINVSHQITFPIRAQLHALPFFVLLPQSSPQEDRSVYI